MALDQAPIRVFNTNLDFRAEINLYESAYFQRLDYGIGDFQIQINLNIPGVEELQEGYIVQFGRDVKKIGIIVETEKQINENGKGGQILIVKGKEAKYIFTQRLIIPPAGSATYTATANSERALKNLVSFQAGSTCPDSNRQLTDFEIDTDQNRGVAYYLNERNTILSDVITNLCLSTEMGYYIYLDEVNKKLRLEVNFGTDHTAEQTTNGQVLFSTERNTIRSGKLTKSYAAYKNVCYVAGEGQGVNRNIRLVYIDPAEPTGWNRRETLLDVKQIASNPDLDAAGAKRLAETQYTVFSSGQFLNFTSYVYGKNFDLGDYVTIKIYDVQQNVKITGVRESWGYGKYEIDFEYDRSYPQFEKTVASRISGLQGVLNNTEIPTTAQLTALAPPGKMDMFAGPTAPTGWLLCDGSAVSRTTYAALFTAIGTAWGIGDGSTTFNLPDMRGAAPAGAGTSTGYAQNETITFAVKHDDQEQQHWHQTENGGGAANLRALVDAAGSATYSNDSIVGNAISAPGFGTIRAGNVTRGKVVGVNFIIKY